MLVDVDIGGDVLTSRRLRKLRKEDSPLALLIEARQVHVQQASLLDHDFFRTDNFYGIWPDAARWTPDLRYAD